MDWFALTCGSAALYAATRWLHGRWKGRRGARAGSGERRRGIPLKVAVAHCEAKWFLQELQQAMSGDQSAMVRVSHMLLSGYGTRQDEAAAAAWMRKAWALQNFKEPADPYLQYELLDLQNSDIPVLNDPQASSRPATSPQGIPNPAPSTSSAAASAQAAARLRQRTRRAATPAAAAAADDGSQAAAAAAAVAVLEADPSQPPSQVQAALDGGYSTSSSSSGSGGLQAGNSTAAKQGSSRGPCQGGSSSRASRQAAEGQAWSQPEQPSSTAAALLQPAAQQQQQVMVQQVTLHVTSVMQQQQQQQQQQSQTPEQSRAAPPPGLWRPEQQLTPCSPASHSPRHAHNSLQQQLCGLEGSPVLEPSLLGW